MKKYSSRAVIKVSGLYRAKFFRNGRGYYLEECHHAGKVENGTDTIHENIISLSIDFSLFMYFDIY